MCPLFLPDFNQVWSSSTHFSIEVPHTSNLTEILPVGAVLLQRADGHTDGRTDTRLKGFFIGYTKVPKTSDFTHRVYLCVSHDCVSKQ